MSEHRFGRFVLDSLARRLLCEGRPIHLSPKAFRLLEFLVETRPKAWSKQELHEHLWPDVVVVEANLANLVAELRHVLDDDAARPRFIRTVPRFGYAFEASASPVKARESEGYYCRLKWAAGSAVLTAGEHLVGRDPAAAVVIDEPSVSRHHAQIRVSNAEVAYEDLGSKNGSYRLGQRLNRGVRLADGDLVRVGLVDVKFRIHPSAGSTQTARIE